MKLKEIILFFVLVCIDQITKIMITNHFELFQIKTIIEGFFHITYVQNTGAAWSILNNMTFLLTLVSVVVCIFLIYWLYKHPTESTYTRLLVCLILSGAFGNMIDRIAYGYVVDFLSFNLFGYPFPVFNVADMYLSCGVVLLLIVTYLKEKQDGTNQTTGK